MAFGLLSIPIDRASGPSIKVFVQVFTQAVGVEEQEPREKTVREKRGKGSVPGCNEVQSTGT